MNIDGLKTMKKGGKIIKSKPDLLIRTMQDDMIALGEKKNNRKASPPDSLPIVELVNKEKLKAEKEAMIRAEEEAEKRKEAEKKDREVKIRAQKEAEIRAREEAEKRKEAEEEAQKEAEIRARAEAKRREKAEKEAKEEAEKRRIKDEKEAEIRAREEAEKRKEAAKEAERQRIKAQKEAEIRAKEEAKRREEAEEVAKKQRIKVEKEAEKQRKIKEKENRKARRIEKIKEIKIKLAKNAPKLIAGLIIISLIIGIGIFFYWWNYIRIIPVSPTHFECKNEQCIEMEGEGVNQCKLDEGCKIIKPVIPELLILSDKTETIELPIKEYRSFIDRLESIYRTKQEENTLNSILIKSIKSTKEEYANFDFFVLISGINIPENIKSAIADSEINGDNYNLFLHNNGKDNRMGLIISMGQDPDLVQNLSAWEETLVADIKPFIFKDEVLESTTEGFQDNTYNGVAMRYINFPTSDLSVDYAIIGDKLIITTSKDSMYAIIDALIN